jgi:hypothetical protein
MWRLERSAYLADLIVGDSVVSKREDGTYDVLRGDENRELVRSGVATLDLAKPIALGSLGQGGRIWYRDWRDAPDHLEPLR